MRPARSTRRGSLDSLALLCYAYSAEVMNKLGRMQGRSGV